MEARSDEDPEIVDRAVASTSPVVLALIVFRSAAAAVPALALLTWVLVHPKTKMVGGVGYGFLFGLAFYLPLLPWIGGLVGSAPWIALSVLEACFPAMFGGCAVLVARLPGWPLWLATVWSLQEWLKSSVPFGGFPWGVTAFSQADGPFLALAHFGGAPLVSLAIALLGTSLCALLPAIAGRLRRGARGSAPAGLIVPAAGICAVLLITAAAAPADVPMPPASPPLGAIALNAAPDRFTPPP
jgi:apolipoprotein N-acyltransferase